MQGERADLIELVECDFARLQLALRYAGVIERRHRSQVRCLLATIRSPPVYGASETIETISGAAVVVKI